MFLALVATAGCGCGDSAPEPATDHSSFLGVNGDQLTPRHVPRLESRLSVASATEVH
jgi:hypothetical protein